MKITIVTHPGQAHRDEFIACCMLVFLFSADHTVEIVRRDPTEADLADESVFVIDVGDQLNPHLNNYDHHQLSRDSSPVCSVSLVLEHVFNQLESAREALSWLRYTEWLDSKGPIQACKEFGLPLDSFFVVSPIEDVILSIFGELSVIDDDAPFDLLHLMDTMGGRWIKRINDHTARIKLLEENAKVVSVDDIVCLDVRFIDPSQSPVFALEDYTKKNLPDVAVVISRDDRGPGLSLYRRNDDPRINFGLLCGNPEVLFVHANGFIAKTLHIDADVVKLIRSARPAGVAGVNS